MHFPSGFPFRTFLLHSGTVDRATNTRKSPAVLSISGKWPAVCFCVTLDSHHLHQHLHQNDKIVEIVITVTITIMTMMIKIIMMKITIIIK